MSASPVRSVARDGFIVRRTQLRDRLDAEYNYALLTTNFRSNFPAKKLRHLATTVSGGTPSKSNPEFWDGPIPWASPKDFGRFRLVDTEDHISLAAIESSATSLVPAGTPLVVVRSGILQHTLPVMVTTRPTAINQDVKALIATGDADAEYLGAYLTVFGRRLLPLITKSGATVQSVSTKQFEEIAIPVPPPAVQRAVVSSLDDAYARADEREKSARKLIDSIDLLLMESFGLPSRLRPAETLNDRVFQVHFSTISGHRWDPNYALRMEAFLHLIEAANYPTQKLGDYVSIVQYGISERATAENIGVPMLRMLNLQDGEWDLSDLKYIQLDDDEKQPHLLRTGDVLFNRTNSKELVGKCNVFDLEGDYVFASYLMRLRLKPEAPLLPEFLVSYLSSSLGQNQIDAVSRQIAGMTNINAEEVRELIVLVPPMQVQERICRKVRELREQAKAIRETAKREFDASMKAIVKIIHR